MAPRRRARGTLVDPINIGYAVERTSKEKFEAIAETAGVSGAVLFERVVDQIELTDKGLPVWWVEPTIEELPIDTA